MTLHSTTQENFMNFRQYHIAITSIGSGVGQSVINSCRLSNLPLRTIGLGNTPFAYGAYDCDAYGYLPTIYSNNYLSELIKKCLEYKINLLIPGLDDEVYILSKEKDKILKAGINVVLSGEKIIELCRDKEQLSNHLNKYANFFVASYNKNNIYKALKDNFIEFPLISKPKDGFASRGTRILNDKKDIENIPDNYVIQELIKPIPKDPNYNYFIEQPKR